MTAPALRWVITRQIKAGHEVEYFKALNQLVHQAKRWPGYDGSEHLWSLSKKNKHMIVSRWANKENWKSWFDSADRQRSLDQLTPHLEVPATDEIFTVLSSDHHYSPLTHIKTSSDFEKLVKGVIGA
jgi:antibiotic biosynthesis monooxygenase (ABM) superfamily enzyme